MLEGIDTDRLLAMTDREKRWFDNIKKAFCHSDEALQSGSAEDECLAELFKAIDTAKTLRRSLRGEDISHHQNKQLFIEFLGLEIPMARPGESEWELALKSGATKKYHFGEIVYDIRCMIHENENLNVAEDVDYHILLDWSQPHPYIFANQVNGTFVCNGYFLWNRLRQLMAKFITGIDGFISFATNGSFSITVEPDMGAIAPERKPRSKPLT
jgi:hypothetical protein